MDKVQRAFDLVSSLSEEEMSELLKRTPTLKKKNKAPREGWFVFVNTDPDWWSHPSLPKRNVDRRLPVFQENTQERSTFTVISVFLSVQDACRIPFNPPDGLLRDWVNNTWTQYSDQAKVQVVEYLDRYTQQES